MEIRRRIYRRSVAEAVKCAVEGIKDGIRTQRNFKIHMVAAFTALALAVFLRLSTAELALVIMCISIVMAAELLNTAIERVVDVIYGDEENQDAKFIKDVSAGAVLIASVGALAIGLLIFIPRVWKLVESFLGR